MQVVLLELNQTRAEQGDDVGRFKMADGSVKGFGERCSSRTDHEMAGSVHVCRQPSCACAVVCWFQGGIMLLISKHETKNQSSRPKAANSPVVRRLRTVAPPRVFVPGQAD